MGDTLFALAIVLPFVKNRRFLWLCLLSAILAAIFVHSLKPLLDLPRPPAVLVSLETLGPAYRHQSFPSGHSATAFVLAGLVLIHPIPRVWKMMAVVWALLVALSRVVVGVHWPIDCLVGAALGLFAVAIAQGFCKEIGGAERIFQFIHALWAGCAIMLATQAPLGTSGLYGITATVVLVIYGRQLVKS